MEHIPATTTPRIDPQAVLTARERVTHGMRRIRTVELDPDFLTLTQPSATDPYKHFVHALIERAWQDATGHVIYPGPYNPAHLTADALAWLQSDQDCGVLLELTGHDAETCLHRMRIRLAGEETGS